jgi:NAD(P)-dependent dehydrogenase (short-subunit alcohol dehydrogenase family)
MNLEGAAPKDFEDLGRTLSAEFGALHGLVHNAATLGTLTPIEHYDFALWHRVMQVNLNAPFMLTRTCLPLLRRAQEAAIVFVSDTVGRIGKPYWGAYAAAKSGLEGLMRTLASELAPATSVRVNSLDPGAVRTQLRRLAYPAENATTLPEPESLVPIFLYLLGPDSQGISGQALSVD